MLLLSVVFLLTSSLSYSASGDGDWGWAASGFKGSWSTSASGLSLVSESSSGCDDPSPGEVFFPFGTTSYLRENAIVRIAVTLTWAHRVTLEENRAVPHSTAPHFPTSLFVVTSRLHIGLWMRGWALCFTATIYQFKALMWQHLKKLWLWACSFS